MKSLSLRLACALGVFASGCGSTKAAQTETKVAGAAERAHARPAPEPLLHRIPHAAFAALVLRQPVFDPLQQVFEANPDLRRELAAFLQAELGLDLTKTRGVVAYALEAGEELDYAVVIEADVVGPLQGAPVGRYRDRAVVEIAADPLLYGASLGSAVAFGTPQGLSVALDLAAGAVAPVSDSSKLAILNQVPGASAAVAVHLPSEIEGDSELATFVERFRIVRGLVTFDPDGRMLVRVDGSDPQRLQQALTLAETAKGVALQKLRAEADLSKQAHQVAAGAAQIVAYHELRRALLEIGPVLQGSSLVASYVVPDFGGTVPVMGVVAALAVPAFIGYVRRSKTVEATSNLDAIFERLRAQHAAALEQAGKSKAKRKRVLAALSKLHVGATPAKVPCGEKVLWSSEELARWKPLGFDPGGPTYYSYELGSPETLGIARGTEDASVLVLRARGDLDCDQELSSFELAVGLDENDGLYHAKGFYIEREIE